MTAFLLEWGPPLTLTYGLTLADLRAMTLAELDAYIQFSANRASDQGPELR